MDGEHLIVAGTHADDDALVPVIAIPAGRSRPSVAVLRLASSSSSSP